MPNAIYTDPGRALAATLCLTLLAPAASAYAQSDDEALLAEQRAMEQEAASDEEAEAARQAEDEAERPGWHKWLWVDASLGYSFANLEAVRYDNLDPTSTKRAASGFSTGVGTGLRLFFVKLGGRYTFTTYGDFQLQAATGEVAFHIPAGIIEPFLRVGAGYGWMNADFGNIDPTVDGAVLDVGAGMDVWVHPFVTVGFAFQTAVFWLRRDRVQECLDGSCDEAFLDEGDAAALQARIELRVGIHI